MSATDKGHTRERDWMKRLKAQGWFACRPRWAGVDVVCSKAGSGYFFDEVKANKEGGPYMNFRRHDRVLLKLAAANAGATPRLVYWPPGKNVQPRVIPASDWPQETPSTP